MEPRTVEFRMIDLDWGKVYGMDCVVWNFKVCASDPDWGVEEF